MPPAVDNKFNNSFPKHDKLKSPLAIKTLYRESQTIVSFPLKCYYLFSERNETKNSVRIAFTVPKKSFKKAVQRNILKRSMREAYRLNYKKIFELFMNQNNKQLQLLIIYIKKEISDYRTIEKTMQEILMKVNEKLA